MAVAEVIAVMVRGALGALSRFGIATWVQHHWASPFPLATLLVNVVGSMALGFVLTALPARPAGAPWLAFIATGFLGSFTTFSTFSWETVSLIRGGSLFLAVLYVIVSLAIALLGVLAGMWIGTRLRFAG